MGTGLSREEFAAPGMQYRGVALWMLNDRLEADELGRWLRGMCEQGWGAVIDRTFNGLRTPYLSDEWHAMMRKTIGLAGELGMKVWLQAGFMPAGIPELEEAHQSCVLVRKNAKEQPETGETLLGKRGGHAYYSRRVAHLSLIHI